MISVGPLTVLVLGWVVTALIFIWLFNNDED